MGPDPGAHQGIGPTRHREKKLDLIKYLFITCISGNWVFLIIFGYLVGVSLLEKDKLVLTCQPPLNLGDMSPYHTPL